MSDSVSSSTDTKPAKERLTFNWPTKFPSKNSSTKVILPFAETKLPVKQRVVFPRFDGNDSKNCDKYDTSGNNDCNKGNNQQDDDDWDAMANMFRNLSPSSPNPWAMGSDNGNGNANSSKSNKRRKYDNQRGNRNHGYGEFRDGYEKNSNRSFPNNQNNGGDNNNRNKFGKKRRHDEREFNGNSQRNSSGDPLLIDWSEITSQSDYQTPYNRYFAVKSISTQTDLSFIRSFLLQSVAVQTDITVNSNYPSDPYVGHQEIHHLNDFMNSSDHCDNKESKAQIIDLRSLSDVQMINVNATNSPCEITNIPINRDPRVAKRTKSFQSL